MTITEKVSYLKGLIDGIELDPNEKTTKVINEMVNVLNDMALQMEDFESDLVDLNDQVDEIDEDLSDVESELYDDEECGCSCEDCEECDGDCDCEDEEDEYLYEVTCPTCGKVIPLTEEMLDEGEIDCECGELLEFDLNEEADEE